MSLALVKLTAALALLSIASYQDIRTREIDDRIWISLGCTGLLLTAIELISGWSLVLLVLFGASVVFGLIIGTLGYRMGLMGGADSKAIMALSVTFPYPPDLGLPRRPAANSVFPMSVLIDALLISILSMAYFVARNLLLMARGRELFRKGIPAPIKVILFLTSTKYDIFRTDWTKVFPMEIVDFSSDPPRVVYSVLRNVNVDVGVEALKRGYEIGLLDREIWGSYGLPMIVFITLGLLAAIFLGDPVSALLLAAA